jgi:ADP-ribosylglycohydrolase
VSESSQQLSCDKRMVRALLSLEGLSVGDAFGESFAHLPVDLLEDRLSGHFAPPPPWFYTDDTAMSISIVRCLHFHGGIEPEWLAQAFAAEYRRQPDRGYGGAARGVLHAIGADVPWSVAAGQVFDGQGSCGNGGAMRSAPIGAYFAEDTAQVVEHSRASAEVTHAHPDGQTGAIAVALAAAWMASQYQIGKPRSHEMIHFVLAHLPQTETYWRLKKALTLPLEVSPRTAASVLGNGSQIISSDTVPFCLWCACRHPHDYAAAIWSTISVFGDCDTNCAIVGSIVALSAGQDCIPDEWIQSREQLDLQLP